MKKIITFCVLSLLATATRAQNYVFTDKEGNIIEDGATISCTEVEDDGFGDILIPSGLFVKNVNAPTNYVVSVEAKISRMDNGGLQLCFPENCQVYSSTGTYEPEGKATIDKGTSKDIMSEWLPMAYGQCTVTYTAKAHQKMGNTFIKKDTYSVTVNYLYTDQLVGDVNGDGLVNALDIQIIINVSASGSHDSLYDLNGDGLVNALDIQKVINIAANAARSYQKNAEVTVYLIWRDVASACQVALQPCDLSVCLMVQYVKCSNN
jgi:hypothetical protein